MRALALVLVAMTVLACRKDSDPDPTPAAEVDPCGTVAGIKKRDVNGAPIGVGDTTDWRPFDEWCPAVEALFSDSVPVTYSEEEPDSLLIAGFPNPTQQYFRLELTGDGIEWVDLRMVDTDHQLRWSYAFPTTVNAILDLEGIGLTNGQVYRIYYRVFHSDGTVHRGHGDVEVIP